VFNTKQKHNHKNKGPSSSTVSHSRNTNQIDNTAEVIQQSSLDDLTPENILQLQRIHGNQFVNKLVQRSAKNQHEPATVIQRKKDSQKQGLLSEEPDGGSMDMGLLNIDDPVYTNPFEDPNMPIPDVSDVDENDPNYPFYIGDESTTLGKEDKMKVGKGGSTGKFEDLGKFGKVGYDSYKIGDVGSKGFGNSVNENMDDVQSSKAEMSDAVKGFGPKMKSAMQETKSAAEGTTGLEDSDVGAIGVSGGVSKAGEVLKPMIGAITSTAGPFLTIIGAVLGGVFKIYNGVNDTIKAKTVYSALNAKAKELVDKIANEDENSNETTSLLQSQSTDVGEFAAYGKAKVLRRFIGKAFDTAIAIGQFISQILAYFTGPVAAIFGGIELALGLVKAAKNISTKIKGLFKAIFGKRGKNREKNANFIVEKAIGGDEDAINTLLGMGAFGDSWMEALQAATGLTDGATMLGSKTLGKANVKLEHTKKKLSMGTTVKVKDKNDQAALLAPPSTKGEVADYFALLKKTKLLKVYTKFIFKELSST